MLFLTIGLALCMYNQIAVEYSRVPVTRAGTDGKRIKQTIHAKNAMLFVDDSLVLTKEIIPDAMHNAHLFMEDDFDLEKQSFVNVNDDQVIKFAGLEAQLDRNALLSLYFNALLSNTYKCISGSPLISSTRDYYTQSQNTELSKIFSTLGYKTKVIPESLAACIQNVEFTPNGKAKKSYYINFRGAKVIGSLYEIKCENDQVNITLLETKELDLKSDMYYENLIANLIIDTLSTREDVSFIPYEIASKSFYSNIQKLVLDYIRDLKSTLNNFDILEANLYDKITHKKSGTISDKSVPFSDIKEQLKANMELNDIFSSLPEDVERYIITDIPYREDLISGYTLVYWEYICKGLFAAHDKKFNITDSRVVDNAKNGISAMYIIAKGEIEIKAEVKTEIIPMIEKTLEEFKYLTPEEKTEIKKLISTTERSFKQCHEIKRKWEALQKMNSRREADVLCREGDIKTLENVIEEAKSLLDGLEDDSYKELHDLYTTTVEWLSLAKEDPKSTGFTGKATKLKAFIKFIFNKLKKKEEERIAEERKQLEDAKKDTVDKGSEVKEEAKINENTEEADEPQKDVLNDEKAEVPKNEGKSDVESTEIPFL